MLNGGTGDDVLSGGEGADKFIFDLKAFGRDSIEDFEDGSDLLWFKRSVANEFSDFTITGDGTPKVVVTLIADPDQTITLRSTANITLSTTDFAFVA